MTAGDAVPGGLDDVVPVRTAHLFGPLTAELLSLLRALPPDAWSLSTTAGGWEVRDVVAHLLDGDLRRISAERDGHSPPAPPAAFQGYGSLVEYLNRLNTRWTAAARRLSPRLMTDLLEFTGGQLAALVTAADPLAPALYPVAWAGESNSPLWLDHGREYTERWHHQDQVREAVGAPALAAAAWLRPVLEVSLLALPHGYRAHAAPAGTALHLEVTGDAGGSWWLVRAADHWRLAARAPTEAAATVTVADCDLARLLLHRLPVAVARDRLHVTGDLSLAAPLLRVRAVMV